MKCICIIWMDSLPIFLQLFPYLFTFDMIFFSISLFVFSCFVLVISSSGVYFAEYFHCSVSVLISWKQWRIFDYHGITIIVSKYKEMKWFLDCWSLSTFSTWFYYLIWIHRACFISPITIQGGFHPAGTCSVDMNLNALSFSTVNIT